jgi:lipoprotein-anchoring transpeptidase ErfK/SrfK
MDRRTFFLSLASTAGLASPAFADRVEVRYNFSSVFSPNHAYGRYSGKAIVDYKTVEKPGTIIIDTSQRKLFYVLAGGKAIAYGIGVGRQGFEWSGTARIGDKAEWPQWRPPKEMIERELQLYGRQLPEVMEGGPNNPLGARALYLYQGSRDTLYRIHGTNQPQTIGQAVSSGCIRMVNEEVIDLYNRVRIGAKVIVL